jgi:multiple sugar transport system substrate-binding protein
MDPKDSPPVTPSATPEGGVRMAPIFEAPPDTQPRPGSQDTIIIPPTQQEPLISTPSTPNPFIPDATPAGSQPPSSHGENPLLRRLLIVGVGIALLAGILLVVRMVLTRTSTPKKVTITYWGLWENDTVTKQLITDFETKNPNITVQYVQQSPKQYRERLQSAINRGEGPDVFRFHNTWIPMLRMQLALVPSTVMTTTEFGNTFFPVAVNNLVAGNSIFGIPLMVDGLGLYINDDLFATAGVNPPTTWTDVANLVPKLTVKNGTAIVTSAIAMGTASNVEHFSDILGLLFFQNGADLTIPTGSDAEQALTFYRNFADPTNPMYTWSDGMDNSVSAFAAGRVAMILAPSWRAHDVVAISPKLRFHIAAVPQLQGNSVAWASYWVEGVSSRSPNQAAAWEFVKYLTGKEGAAKLYTEESKTRLFGEPYARKDLADTIQNDPYTGAYVKQAVYARSFPIASRTFDNGLNDRLIQYLTDAVNGMGNGGSPTQVLQTVAAGFRQVLSSYGLMSASATVPTP